MLYLKLTQEDFQRNFYGDSCTLRYIDGDAGRTIDGQLYRDVIGKIYEIPSKGVMVEIVKENKKIKEARELLDEGDTVIFPCKDLHEVKEYIQMLKEAGISIIVKAVDNGWEVVAQKG